MYGNYFPISLNFLKSKCFIPIKLTVIQLLLIKTLTPMTQANFSKNTIIISCSIMTQRANTITIKINQSRNRMYAHPSHLIGAITLWLNYSSIIIIIIRYHQTVIYHPLTLESLVSSVRIQLHQLQEKQAQTNKKHRHLHLLLYNL